MQRRFRIAEHREYGYVGLVPLWMPGHQSDPLTGMGVAHDVLEHGTHDKCEWQGLGGSVLVRGVSGYFNRKRSGNSNAAENIASDFIELYHLWEAQRIPDPGRTRKVADDYAEEIIHEAVQEGCKLIRSELRDQDREMADVRNWTDADQQRRMIGWMRHGYRACAHRWRDSIGWLCDTFERIESEADTFLKDHDDYKGSIVILSFDPRRAAASFELESDPYEEY